MNEKIEQHAIPWPPSADDLNEDACTYVVSPKLFIFLALATGMINDTPTESLGYVHVDEDAKQKLFSVCQDLATISSKGQKLAPKSIALAVTQIAGFDHAMSYGSTPSSGNWFGHERENTGKWCSTPAVSQRNSCNSGL